MSKNKLYNLLSISSWLRGSSKFSLTNRYFNLGYQSSRTFSSKDFWAVWMQVGPHSMILAHSSFAVSRFAKSRNSLRKTVYLNCPPSNHGWILSTSRTRFSLEATSGERKTNWKKLVELIGKRRWNNKRNWFNKWNFSIPYYSNRRSYVGNKIIINTLNYLIIPTAEIISAIKLLNWYLLLFIYTTYFSF